MSAYNYSDNYSLNAMTGRNPRRIYPYPLTKHDITHLRLFGWAGAPGYLQSQYPQGAGQGRWLERQYLPPP